jgi:hypothetical protein
MRIMTPTATEPGFIALCIQLAQATFSEVMPSTADPKIPASLSRTNVERAYLEPRWVSALANWFHRQEVKEREAYLAKSADIFDLERRIRYLERRPYY